jgi:hypothetical protein
MTLIMGCITREYAVLVSDRRLTWHAPGRTIHRTPSEENRNKAVLLCGHFYLGYTGLAAIFGTDTDQWLAELLVSQADPSTYFRTIADESTRVFSRLRGDKRQAYMAVGWSPTREEAELQLFAVLITNYLADDGRTWLPKARDEFTVRPYQIRPSANHLLCWVGQELFMPEITKLQRYLQLHIAKGWGTARYRMASCHSSTSCV